MEEFLGRKQRVEAGSSHHVEGEFSLWQEAVPQVHWEALVGGAEASLEVVLEGAYGSFCCIDSVHSWWSFLVVNVFLVHEICECFGAFVV